jgi:hypothetical protein
MKTLSTLNRRRLIRVGVLCVVIPGIVFVGYLCRDQHTPYTSGYAISDSVTPEIIMSEEYPHITTSNPAAITPFPQSLKTYCEAGECVVPDKAPDSLWTNPEITKETLKR